ncbi:MAG: exodeoxyribonuclease VII large subunit [Actinobacteria bacterium]|nr:exodeoxyribonuclease VII large subunit [Actinomycetota bacterium]
MGMANSQDAPLSVAQMSKAFADYVRRLGEVWVEGQLSEVRPRPGARLVYMRLRDTSSETSVSLVAPPSLLQTQTPGITDGAQVVVLARLEYWSKRGDLHLRVRQIRVVGLGELLARLEQLRALLAAEGLFAPERKQPIPFLPVRIGLICGRNSEAEKDVKVGVRRRWPGVAFETREVVVQGAAAVPAVTTALQELDEHPEVDVIVITRGGGSVEDLLPFSNESLLRAVAAARTPVVSAIGHERDRPLLDDVADVRASTPTHSAELLVPHWKEEQERIVDARADLRRRITNHLTRERDRLTYLRQSGALRAVVDRLTREQQQITRERADARRAIGNRLAHATAQLRSLQSGLHALSPAATLDRGYALVTDQDGRVAFGPDDIPPGEPFNVRLREGAFAARRLSDPDAGRDSR